MNSLHNTASAVTSNGSSNQSGRDFLVSRQDFRSRAFTPVGILCCLPTGGFIFEYLEDFLGAPDSQPLGGLPLGNSPFISPRLFPVFAERIIGAHRIDKPDKLKSLGLESTASDIEILSRSEGVRPVDAIRLTELVDISSGVIDLYFFVHGVRYQQDFESVLATLHTGSPLSLIPEPGNKADANAILVKTEGRPIGYVPHALSHLLSSGHELSANVVRVNSPQVGANLRLLVHVGGTIGSEFKWPWQRHATYPHS